jgi:GT2 family glycosyltransferase
MISIIVCSKKEPAWTIHERNALKTVGATSEYLRMDNRAKKSGICAAYNSGVARARGELLVFVHEDVFFMEPGWGRVLEQKFAADPAIGLIGVAGTQYLSRDRMSWAAAGRPYIRGRVVHELNNGAEFMLTVFSPDKTDAEVAAADGLFFAVRRELFARISFDERTFPGYHFYDLDICMQARRTHRIVVTWDLLLKHCSAGSAGDAWRASGRRFLEKYKNELPASCAGIVQPDFSMKREFGRNFDLRGKASQEIIC